MFATLLANIRATVLFCALILVAGLSALQVLPRTEDPEMSARFAEIITFFPGADAERVESLVSEPLERAVRTLPYVKEIDSSSSSGISVVVIELEHWLGVDELDNAWSDVQEEVQLIAPTLPSGVLEPVLEKDRFPALTLVFGITLQGVKESEQEDNLALLSRYALDLESELLKVPGTEYVETYGDPGEEIQVVLDMPRVISSGLTVAEISERISAADTTLSAGSLSGSGLRMSIEISGRFEDLERLRRIPLRASDNGVLLLGDLASISRVPITPPTTFALINGARGVAVGARMNPDKRSDLWRKETIRRVEAYAKTLPSNVQIDLIFDQDRYTTQRLGNLLANVLIGFSLIAAVLFFSLGWRSALIVSASLPLTILFALAAMNMLDRSIHQMSVTGLIIALGIMVDNAIVMADTVARFKAAGLGRVDAQMRAVRKLWVPLMGSTLTTIFAFLPMIVQEGPTGEFVSDISYAVIFSLLGSFLISQIVVSSLAARFLSGAEQDRNAGWIEVGLKMRTMGSLLRKTILLALRRPLVALALVLVLPVSGFIAISNVPTEFFPASDRDMINLEVFLPQSANAQATRDLIERVSTALATDQEIESLHWFIGSNAPKVYYNLLMNADGAQNYAQAMIKMPHFRIANRKVAELQARFDAEFPEAQFVVRRFQQGPPFAPVEVRLFGNNVEQLAILGEEIKRHLLQLDSVSQAQTSVSSGQPKAYVAADEAVLQVIGLGLADAAIQTQSATDGLVQAELTEDTQTLPIRVRAGGYKVDDGLLLADFPLQGKRDNDALNSGLMGTPLSALADVEFVPVRGSISRRNGERLNSVTAFLKDGALPSETLAEFKQALEDSDFVLPDGYRLEFGGESESSDDAVGGLLRTLGLILTLMVISIMAAFNSFRLTATIFFVAFLSAGMGLLSLSLSGFPFGFTSILGVMAMIGLAINAAIVIIAECRSDAEAVNGSSEAIAQSVMHCSRHICSTTITTIMGFMPLLLAGGGFWPPFAIVVAGGTLLTTMLSLILVPVVFSWLTKRSPFPTPEHYNNQVAIPG